jgi:hypothetical protein
MKKRVMEAVKNGEFRSILKLISMEPHPEASWHLDRSNGVVEVFHAAFGLLAEAVKGERFHSIPTSITPEHHLELSQYLDHSNVAVKAFLVVIGLLVEV